MAFRELVFRELVFRERFAHSEGSEMVMMEQDSGGFGMTNGTEQQEEVLADGSNKLMTVTKCAHCWSLSPLLKMRDGLMIAILCLLDIIPYTIATIFQVSNM